MRKMEAEAYLLGNGFLFRDWEDQLKQKKESITMSEAYKRDKMEEEELEEGMPVADIAKDKPCPKNQAKNKQGKCVPVAEEDVIEEDGGVACPDGKEKIYDDQKGWVCPGGESMPDEDEPKNENWLKGNKDQLLFETLMKKWAK